MSKEVVYVSSKPDNSSNDSLSARQRMINGHDEGGNVSQPCSPNPPSQPLTRGSVERDHVHDAPFSPVAAHHQQANASISAQNASASQSQGACTPIIPDHPGPHFVIQSGHFSMQGIRPEMEDRVVLLPHPTFNQTHNVANNIPRSFFAVFDGHGGDVSAEYCRQHVHNNMLQSHEFLNGDVYSALRLALLKTEQDFCTACKRINLLTSSGTTAVTCYIQADQLIVANIGDSRAVICRSGRAVDASIDHKPGRREERARIEALGGRIGISEEDAFRTKPRSCPTFWTCMSSGRPLRVFPGGLSVSRTIGDISMKSTALIIAEPEMFQCTLSAADEFVILACDGVWDVMNSQSAVDCVRGNLFRSQNNVEEAARHLAQEAFRKGSTDNISVVVITLELPDKAKDTKTTKK